MTEAKAVFLSYASEDAEVALRLCEALRAAGFTVWFDKDELRGGEAWDSSIRRQIKACHLFLAIVSKQTQAREEGYFRREWKLAVHRTLDMAEDRAFLIPVLIDDTTQAQARVPEKFLEVQWIYAPDGVPGDTLLRRLHHLLDPANVAPPPAETPPVTTNPKNTAQVPATPQANTPPPRPIPATTAATATASTSGPSQRRWLIGLAIVAGVACAAVFVPGWLARERARSELLPQIQDAIAHQTRGDTKLLNAALKVEEALPGNTTLAPLWPRIALPFAIETEPAGAEVVWKEYDQPDSPWQQAGVTPFKDVKLPRTILRLEIRKAGFQTIELVAPRFLFSNVGSYTQKFKLDPTGSLPEGMVRVPAGAANMIIVGLERFEGSEVPEFLVDRFEVTNRQYKAFVEAGGYTDEHYWQHPILSGGRTVPLKEALAQFKDRTGRPGPATWEAGTYPDGTQDHPVTGVSWYEASAYAVYAKKSLPTAFQWSRIADTALTEFLVPYSNFESKATWPVGSHPGISTYGVYDIAGNAREWIENASNHSTDRYILGGGWNDPTYAFNDSYAQPAIDRSDSNGFRCVQEIDGASAPADQHRALAMDVRDYSHEKPVDDRTFDIYARQFAYDHGPLNAKIESTLETDNWTVERVSVDSAYGKERLTLYVYRPLKPAAKLQPVIFFPGSGSIQESHFDPKRLGRVEFIVKSGRALVWPIYKSTYERQDGLKSDLAEETINYKDHVVMWARDLGRSIDYLETRPDMATDKVGYLGISWGGELGPVFVAVDKRIKAAVFNVGGLSMQKELPEADPLNFLPRVHQPVLMLNGRYDMYFPVETSQIPMFEQLGSPAADKKHFIYPSGHIVPVLESTTETLGWFDKYLGAVR